MKTHSSSNKKYTPEVPLILLALEISEREHFYFCSSSFFFFFFSLMHNSKSIRRIQTICKPNDCPTIRNYCSLLQNCVCTASPYIYRYLVRNYARQQTHVPYHCILHTKRRFYCQRCIVL